jgi:1-acyl-sn-glycerol-3-phosphate acyltransferase
MFLGILYFLVHVFIAVFFPFKVIGKDKIPQGATLICANHSSYLDIIYLYLMLGSKSKNNVIAKKELFRFPVFSSIIKRMGAFPVSRDGSDIAALKRSLKVLAAGQRLIIFPEGRRIAADELSNAKGGAGMIAMRAACPVVPVYIPSIKRIFRKITVVVGDAFYVERPQGRPDREGYQRASDEIIERIFSLRAGA